MVSLTAGQGDILGFNNSQMKTAVSIIASHKRQFAWLMDKEQPGLNVRENMNTD